MAKPAEKMTRRDQGAASPVPEAFRPLATGLEENWKTILIVVGAALGALVVLAIVLQVQSRHREEAAQAVGDVLGNVNWAVLPPTEDEGQPEPGEVVPKPAAGQKAVAETKPAPKPKPRNKDETYPSEEAKQEAIAKQAQETIDHFGSQPAARIAQLTLGDADYNLGKYQQAVESYSKFLSEAPEDDYLRAYAEVGMAYSSLRLGKKEEALAAAKALADRPPGGFGRDLGLLTEGHVAEDSGQLDLAKQIYRQLRGEAPDSTAGREAGERLTLLGEAPPVAKTVSGSPPAAK